MKKDVKKVLDKVGLGTSNQEEETLKGCCIRQLRVFLLTTHICLMMPVLQVHPTSSFVMHHSPGRFLKCGQRKYSLEQLRFLCWDKTC